MEKWADYVITDVHYGTDPEVIEEVKASPDNGDALGQGERMVRADVVKKIENGETFVTGPKGGDGQVRRGEDVHVFIVDGRKYIRTDSNGMAADNLENLPVY